MQTKSLAQAVFWYDAPWCQPLTKLMSCLSRCSTCELCCAWRSLAQELSFGQACWLW